MTNNKYSKLVLDDLRSSGLDPEDALKEGWRELQPPNITGQLKDLIGFSSYDGVNLARTCTSFLAIQYPRKNFCRVKLYPGVNGAKYLQPKNTPVEAYIPDVVWKLRHKPTKPLIITEGEKKTLCLVKHGYNTIGLPGVWCFRGKDGGLLDDLQEFYWRDRVVHICFDSDAIFNKQVVQAEMELALRLWREGTKVYIIRIPQTTHAEKMGADDYIVAHGAGAFKKLLDEAKVFQAAYQVEIIDLLASVTAKLHVAGVLFEPQIKKIAKQIESYGKEVERKDFLSVVDNFIRNYRKSLDAKGHHQAVNSKPALDLKVFDGFLGEFLTLATKRSEQIQQQFFSRS